MELFFSLLFFFWVANAQSIPSVISKLGVINGKIIPVSFKGNDYTINRYSGLRYAKAPVGELRFQKPQPYGAFESPFNGSEFTSACQQTIMMALGVDTVDEDCLSLNVYVPTAGADQTEGYAVMISFHGGGLGVGAATVYPGEVLAALGNVIVITINYRLGMLGFANSGDRQVPGNMGLWDQRMALQWVHDNIDSFGGDNSRVTIFGQSAGGTSVMLQGLYPGNQGLFHNIIAQSGSASSPFYLARNNLDFMEFVADKLGCKTDDAREIVACLRSAKIQDIMAKLNEIAMDLDLGYKIQFMPTIDGDFIKQAYADLIKDSKVKRVDQIEFFRSINLINGVNTDDGAMYLPMLGQADPEQIYVSEEQFRTSLLPMLINFFWNFNERDVPEFLLKVITQQYMSDDNSGNWRYNFVKYMTDQIFAVPGREWLDVHTNSTSSNTYFYSFDADVERQLIPTPSWVKGAVHGDELLAIFGYCMSTKDSGMCTMTNMTAYQPPEWELALSERMIAYWSNFAKFGNPNGNAAGDLLPWPQTKKNDTAYLVFNKNDSVNHDNLYAKEVTFWREIAPVIWDTLDRTKCQAGGTPVSSASTLVQMREPQRFSRLTLLTAMAIVVRLTFVSK